jgi:hypothetical protein
VQFVLRTNPRRETSPEGTRRARKRRKNFSRQILNTGPTAVGSARSCTTVSREERTGVFFFFHLRNPDVILTVRSRDTWRDPIPSQNRESGVGRARELALQKPRYAKSRNPETILAVHFRGQVAAHHRIVISAFRVRGFKLSKKLDIATREIPIRETPIRSQPSVCQDTWRASQRPSAFRGSGFQAVKET